MVKRAVNSLRNRPQATHHPDQIARNAIQETLKRPLCLIEPRGRTHQPHKNLVRHFFGNRGTSGHVQGEAVKGRLPPFVELGERVLVAFPHQTVEFLVAGLHQRSLSIDPEGRKVPESLSFMSQAGTTATTGIPKRSRAASTSVVRRRLASNSTISSSREGAIRIRSIP